MKNNTFYKKKIFYNYLIKIALYQYWDRFEIQS